MSTDRGNKIRFKALILNEKQEVLLLLCEEYPGKHFWDILGGRIDREDIPVEGVLREIKKDYGVDAEESEFLGNYGTILKEKSLVSKLPVEILPIFKIKLQATETKIEDALRPDLQWFKFCSLPKQLSASAHFAISKIWYFG